MRVLYVPYATWKAVSQTNGFTVYDQQIDTDTYQSWCGGLDLIYRTDVLPVNASDYTTTFPTRTTVTDEDEAIAYIVGLGGTVGPYQIDGTPQFALGVRLGKETIQATHNFADRTTWYSESLRVTSGSLSPMSGNLIFTSSHADWIDMTHGKIFDEASVAAAAATMLGADHGYDVEVFVDGVPATPSTPFIDNDGDYRVNYESGSIEFFSPVTGTVEAHYSHADTSGWILKPYDDKVLTIEKAEIQFTEDIDYSSTIVMQVYGNADFFAPQLGLPSGTPIPIETTKYKTIAQMVDESVGLYPPFPDIGGSRKIGSPTYILQFNYSVAKRIYSSLGMFLRIYLEPDTVMSGTRAVGTFYLLSNLDPGPVSGIAELTTST